MHSICLCNAEHLAYAIFFYHKLNFSVLIKVFVHVDPFKMKRNLMRKSHRWLWKCQPAFCIKRVGENPIFKAMSVALQFAILLSESWSWDTPCVGSSVTMVAVVQLQCWPQVRCIIQSAEWVNYYEFDISYYFALEQCLTLMVNSA